MRHVPPKRWLAFNGLHSVISQKIELFITTALRTSNSTISEIVTFSFHPPASLLDEQDNSNILEN
jgi:hypothetical protein